MNRLMLFTDGSADVKSGVGYGAYLALPADSIPNENLKQQVKVRRFTNTSSTRLELETLIWALSCISPENRKISVYTDSQNIVGLINRRKKLEQNNYLSKNNRLLNNQDLYIEIYKIMDQMDIELIKAKGHQPSAGKNSIHQLFAIVDKTSRNALRKELKEHPLQK